MSNIRWSANLVGESFPFLYRHAKRSVLDPQYDETPRENLAQMVYCENVMPTRQGIIAVAMQRVVNAAVGKTFDFLFTLRGPTNEVILFSPANGKNQFYNNSTQGWSDASADLALSTDQYPVSTSYVQGRSFVLYATQFIGEYNFTTNTLASVTPTWPAGITIANIVAICGASNYNLAFTKNKVLWSTPNDPLEFADTNIGAGGQIPVDLRGTIVGAAAIGGGFMIYTTENVVAAFFTNDAAIPFRFVGVDNAGGVTSMQRVASDAATSGHFTFGSGGIQTVSLQKAATDWPEVSDFLSGKEFESWDKTQRKVVREEVIGLDCALVFLASRYLIISYGRKDEDFGFALVYDTALQRWGKLKVSHVDVALAVPGITFNSVGYDELTLGYDAYDVAYSSFSGSAQGALPNQSTFAFLNSNGAVRIMTLNTGAGVDTISLAIFGRYQVRRDKKVTWQRSQIDGATEDTDLLILPSLSGFTRDNYVTPTRTEVGKWGGRTTAQNFDLAFLGPFDFSNLLIEAMMHGKN